MTVPESLQPILASGLLGLGASRTELTAPQPSRHAIEYSQFVALDFPPDRELVEGLLPVQGFAILLAAEKTGKSLLGLQLALCVAGGVSFLGRETKQCPVLLIEEEGTPMEMQDRILGQVPALGLETSELPLHFSVCERYRLDDPASVEELDEEMIRTGARLLVLGPLAQLAEIRDENKAAEFNAISRVLTNLAHRHQALVMLAHHRRKDDVKAGAPKRIRAFFDSSRGSNALTSGIDAGIGLMRDPEDVDGTVFVMRRNGAASRFPVRLDPASLTFWTTGETASSGERPSLDQVEVLVLSEAGFIPRSVVAQRIPCSPTTARDRLDRLVAAGRLSSRPGEKGATLYGPPPPVAVPGLSGPGH